MKIKLRLNLCAGDGVGIERSFDFCDTWSQVGYINTGATNSTVNLAEFIVKAVNCHYELLEALEEYVAEWDSIHQFETHRTGFTTPPNSYNMAKEAIAKAKEE